MAAGDIRDTGPHNPIREYQVAASPAQVAINTTAARDITVTGVTTADILLNVVKPTAQAGLGIVGARIKEADTVEVVFSNNTGSAITPTASEVYKFVVIKGA